MLHTASAQPERVDRILFINDADCVSTLLTIKTALKNKTNFCVSSDKSLFTESENNQQQTKNDNVDQQDHSNAYLYCLSSGSTGKPKLICRSHASWVRSFQVTKKNAMLTQNDSYAIIGKLSHSLTLYSALEAAYIGADLHALAELRPDKQYAAMCKLGTSIIYATPTQLRLLCSDHSLAETPNTKLRYIFCGGGKLDIETLSLIQNYFPQACVKEFYGASETSFITMSDENTPIASVGRAYPGVEIRIKPVTNNTGEVWVKSPYLFECYRKGVEPNTQWDNQFLWVGELGHLDEEGYLYLNGRRSRMVNIADNIVFPEQIETLINQHSDVRHCAVIPTPDQTRGTTLIAIVEVMNIANNDTTLRAELLSLCREKFGNLKSPREIIFVEKLPLQISGKIDLQTITQAHQST